MKNPNEYLRYDPETGHLFWIKRANARCKMGVPIQALHKDGYYKLNFDYKCYLAHRMCWFLFYGEWPSNHIDHINGDRKDNRIKNMRLATKSQNAMNAKIPYSNTSGAKNVLWVKRENRWIVTLKLNGKYVFRKSFVEFEEANAFARQKRREVFGDFANDGIDPDSLSGVRVHLGDGR